MDEIPNLSSRDDSVVWKFIQNQDTAPRSRRVRWKAEVGLNASDKAVMDHEFSPQVFDQLNVSELACMELIFREMQMPEYRHRERIPCGSGNDDLQEDLHLYMVSGESRGMLMIAPALWDH